MNFKIRSKALNVVFTYFNPFPFTKKQECHLVERLLFPPLPLALQALSWRKMKLKSLSVNQLPCVDQFSDAVL